MSFQCLKNNEVQLLPESFAEFLVDGVTVHEFEPNLNCLEWSTCCQISGALAPVPGSTLVIEQAFKRLIKQVTKVSSDLYPPFVYANPAWLVSATTPDQEFLVKAEEAREEWKLWLRSFLRSGYYREYKRTSKISRQLVFSGVLIANHRHRFPNAWPKTL